MKKWSIFLITIVVVLIVSYVPLRTFLVLSSFKMQSNSMSHSLIKYCYNYNIDGACDKWSGEYEICGLFLNEKTLGNGNKFDYDFNHYWDNCGSGYIEKGISKEMFLNFPLKNGINKGDILFVTKVFEPKVGDIVIFKPNKESTAPNSIPHRIIYINGSAYGAKGDHNEKQLTSNNNIYRTDETKILREQITGKITYSINSYLLYFIFFIITLTVGIVISLILSGVLKKE